VPERDEGMRTRRLLLDDCPDLLHYVQQAVLRVEREDLLRCESLRHRPNLLYHILNALLCKQGQDLLWQHCMPSY
jgi:hypothetical protein